jgi:fluoroacetyl-CoA thioesterase
MNILVGTSFEQTLKVEKQHLASSLGSGTLDVFGTPAMIALMELAALTAVAPYIPTTSSTVGTELNIKHLKASPLGAVVTAKATVIEADGRRIRFEVKVVDEAGVTIGEGLHERFVVDIERFMAKL